MLPNSTERGCGVSRVENRPQNKCTYCGEIIFRTDVADHLWNTCPFAPALCTATSELEPLKPISTTINDDESVVDQKSASVHEAAVASQGGCAAIMPRALLIQHRERDCPMSHVPCPFAASGCQVRMRRCVLDAHCETFWLQHAYLLSSAVADLHSDVRSQSLSS